MDRYPIPHYSEIDEMSQQERAAIMVVKTGDSPESHIEQLLRDAYVHAIITHSSDIHIVAKGDSANPVVQLSIRTPRGLLNFQHDGKQGRHFKDKLFQLANIANGGSTPQLISTRFKVVLPNKYAAAKGLVPKDNAPYHVDVRVQYLNTFEGFSFITRLLDQQRAPKLEEFGLSQALLSEIKKALNQPSGLFLVTGPTGSGKTTFLNACIGYLNNGQRSIFTIEDPVEFTLTSEAPVHQLQVNGEITFAKGLRAGLRSDPDLILIGEIRDEETMQIALQAAQTGHIVLASLHANHGAETVSRALDLLADKAADAPRLAGALKFVVATRLLDRYEGEIVERDPTYQEGAWMETYGVPVPDKVREVQPATKRGKVPIVEGMYIDYEMMDCITSPTFKTEDIYMLAKEQIQYESLPMAGARAVAAGLCRLDECETALEGHRAAKQFPSMRSRLAKDMRVSLDRVSEILDSFYKARHSGGAAELDEFIRKTEGTLINVEVKEGLE